MGKWARRAVAIGERCTKAAEDKKHNGDDDEASLQKPGRSQDVFVFVHGRREESPNILLCDRKELSVA